MDSVAHLSVFFQGDKGEMGLKGVKVAPQFPLNTHVNVNGVEFIFTAFAVMFL